MLMGDAEELLRFAAFCVANDPILTFSKALTAPQFALAN